MSSTQFTALIRLPFPRGSFVDPPQAQWDADKDRQLWKVISKSSKTSDLNWVELASKFQVPPTFLLQQAAWLYERHFEHVRNQMKKVSGSNVTAAASGGGGSTLTPVGGVAMQRAGSGGAGHSKTTSALSGHRKNSPSLGLQEAMEPAPALTRTPSTTTLTQSRAQAQQLPTRTLSARSAQRPNLARPTKDDRSMSPGTVTHTAHQEPPDSPEIPASSSSSSSSLSDTDHPAHRSQLFKRPPRFQQKRPRDLAPFAEGDGTQDGDDAGSQGNTMLPFASAARRHLDTSRQGVREQNSRLVDRQKVNTGAKQSSPRSQVTTETASSMTSSASASDAPYGPQAAAKSPASPNFNHRAAMANLGSPRAQALRRKEGSEGTPSMGSSFSDIDDAGISQSALEEALLSNMQHGRMTPALTLHYTLGSNSIDTVTVAASIYSLSTHPGRARTEPNEPGTVEVMTCNRSYLTAFWSASASLLDYFADFHATDTPLMQSVWFHLLDTWQAASPVALYKHDHKFWHSHEAQTFKNDYEETLALFQRLVGHPQGQRTRRGYTDEKHTEAVIHAPSGHIEAKAGAYETGPFISGLKPWQQFLCAGAPGFAPSSPSDGDDIVARGAQPSAYDPYTRSIPQPAIALMQSHTSRARTLLARLTHAQNPSDFTQTLAAFDASALARPARDAARRPLGSEHAGREAGSGAAR
ncbi:hypothetical protein E8E12_006558 [Didymella heteroderae]|uniref:Autophagy-related protein 29 n=1 Tax=Didymella heteroderae TaxID=1769908 RepID=A0A9P4WLQ5_9PLEO|nr:hypothetical protein E8E12_006558 [Didymella heteroderae]